MTLHSRVCFAKLTEYIAYLSPREDLSVSLSTERGGPVGDRTGRPAEQSSQEAQIRALLDQHKEQILAECQARTDQHEFQAARAEEDHQLLQQLLKQKLELRQAHQRSLTEMEELRKFQSSTFDTIARRRLVEDQNTILELSGRVQELQNEVNCMNDSKDFQDAESVRSGNSQVTSRPVSSPPSSQFLKECKDILLECRAAEKGRQAFGTHMVYRETFFQNPDASSSAPYPQELHQWSSSIEEPLHSSTVEKE